MFWSMALSVVLLAQAEKAKKEEVPIPTCAMVVEAKEKDRDFERTSVRPLLVDLRSPKLETREEAEKKLTELGPRVLDYLPDVDDQTQAELKLRLGRIRDKLQKTASGDVAKPSKVTLKGEMTLAEAISQISTQTGNRIIDSRGQDGQEAPEVKVTVDFQDTPFWEALDKLADQAGLAVYFYPDLEEKDPPTVALRARDENETPLAERKISYTGPFRIELVGVAAERSPKLTMDRQLQLKFEIAWEPRLSMLAIQVPLADVSATDDKQAAVAVRGEGTRNPDVVSRSIAAELVVPLELPSREAKKIAGLKVKMIALVPGRVDTFCFSPDELTANKPVEKRRAGLAVVLERVIENNEQWQMRVVRRFDNAQGSLESHLQFVQGNKAMLIDGKKNEIVENAGYLQGSRQNELTISHYFDKELDLKKHVLIVKAPSVMMNATVDFEIKDIELP